MKNKTPRSTLAPIPLAGEEIMNLPGLKPGDKP
jgi:hypothetical protein